MAPIVDARTLQEVGFGYDTAEVNAFLDRLGGRDKPRVTQTPVRVGTPLPEHGEELYPPPEDGHEPPGPETAAVLAEISRAQFLPPRRQFQQGYDAVEVDVFAAILAEAVHAGESIVPAIQQGRFTMARRGHKAYDVMAVDHLLDRIGALAAADDKSADRPLPVAQERPPGGSRRKTSAKVLLVFAAVLVVLVVLASVL